ncbi:MAG: PQQ-dependent sugar dehydrogenase, partial [Verrucomicrobiae bacterium]|nr:PQQ-dependent sugar dehydrogenase [Verrucomicrobiae bacterium]
MSRSSSGYLAWGGVLLNRAVRCVALACCLVAGMALSADSPAALQRTPWTASRIEGSSEPAKRCTSEPAFEAVTLSRALEMVLHEKHFYLMEQGGKIWSFAESGVGGDAEMVIDLKALHSDLSNAYGLAFHPDAERNRAVYVAYTIGSDLEDGTKVSRFRLTDSTPPRIDPATEEVLITWRSGGHNGANLQFGP